MRPHSLIVRLSMTCALFVLGTSLVVGQTATPSKTDPKKTPAKKDTKKDNDQKEEKLEVSVYNTLKAQFKAEDINNSGYLEQSELIAWLGLANGPAMLKKYDTDADGKLSMDEFEAWAKEYADKYAKWLIEEEEEAEEALKKIKEQYAKASAQVRQQLDRQRQRYEWQRDRRRLQDRIRDLQRRRR